MKKKRGRPRKKKSKKPLLIIGALVLLLILVNYPILDKILIDNLRGFNSGTVQRIIDGDTVIIDGESIRLLGINAPEKGEYFYEEAKNYLENRILNKEVKLEFGKDRYDKYNRMLAYIFFKDKNINEEMVDQGYANYYFPSGEDKYFSKLKMAWNSCILKNVNLCQKSEANCSECIEIVLDDALQNICNSSCDLRGWSVKAQGRQIIDFSSIVLKNEIFAFDLNLIETGDTLFLRDSEGGLVLWKELNFID